MNDMDKDTRKNVSILTDPMPRGREFLPEVARRFVKFIKRNGYPGSVLKDHGSYRGHPAVTRSLVEGLEKIGASFNYNPPNPSQLADRVVVLSGIRTLRQAIRLKRNGCIKRLFAGPNIVTFSSDYDSLLASPEIDRVITPCEWVIDMYLEDCKNLAGRCFSWPAGVNADWWRPDQQGAEVKQVLIFNKPSSTPAGLAGWCAEYLRRLDWRVDTIEYGTFTHAQYLHKLRNSSLMIGISASESQGIAWSEAWSVNVPTMIWRNIKSIYRGRTYHCSTAPYLSDHNGLFFDNMEHFKEQFSYWQTHREQFAPRKWILDHMTDEVCAAVLYNMVSEC